MPATVEHVDHVLRDARHLGLVHGKARDDVVEIAQQLCPVELGMIGGESEIGAVHLGDLEQPMGELEIAIAGVLGVPQRLHESIIGNPVELAGDHFEADIGHCSIS